jgi:hypothetical protein
MVDEIRKFNPYLRFGVLVFFLVLILWNFIQDRKPLIRTGQMEYRMVSGTRDGHFQVILLETTDRYVILDSAYRKILVSEDGELVSRPKQMRLLEKYQNIEYRVGFNEESAGAKPGYRVTRELFNGFKFGEPMKYEVNKKQRDSLVGLAK